MHPNKFRSIVVMHCLKQTFQFVFSNHPADDDLKGQSIAIAKADIPIESNRVFCLSSLLLLKPSSENIRQDRRRSQAESDGASEIIECRGSAGSQSLRADCEIEHRICERQLLRESVLASTAVPFRWDLDYARLSL
jgi:hypothetical protein